MVTFKANIEINTPNGWTAEDVAVALGELNQEYKIEMEGVVVQTEGGKEVGRKEFAYE